MLKKFLLGLVVVCGGGVANAALLVNYAFTGSSGSTFTPPSAAYGSTGAVAPGPTSFSSILTAGAFQNQGTVGNGLNGAVNSDRWRSANSIAATENEGRFNVLSLTPIVANLGSASIRIDSVSFNLGKLAANNGNVISLRVQYRTSSFGSWVDVGTGSTETNATIKANSLALTTPIVLTSSSASADFRFLWSRTDLTGTDSQQGVIDDLSFFGDYVPAATVPEPTSMAVFGLLGAGVAARRFRRKA
jgi:hypothetical protein